jgi:hypothetical protein
MADDSLASCGAAVTMAGPDDEDTFAERLLNFPRAIFRWASPAPRSGSRTTRSGTTGSRTTGSAAGCLNPLTLLKLLVGLLLVVLLPFYMLPLLMVRIATLGRSSIRYNSVITVTSGEQARWGYGALDAVPDLPSVQAGAAAIAAHDPDFEPGKLMNWAMAATELIRVSLTSGDATPATDVYGERALPHLSGPAGIARSGRGGVRGVVALHPRDSRRRFVDPARR